MNWSGCLTSPNLSLLTCKGRMMPMCNTMVWILSGCITLITHNICSVSHSVVASAAGVTPRYPDFWLMYPQIFLWMSLLFMALGGEYGALDSHLGNLHCYLHGHQLYPGFTQDRLVPQRISTNPALPKESKTGQSIIWQRGCPSYTRETIFSLHSRELFGGLSF